MATKLVSQLVRGDLVALEDGGTATVIVCKLFPLIECANGRAYEVAWHDEDGQRGVCIAGGNDEVEILVAEPASPRCS